MDIKDLEENILSFLDILIFLVLIFFVIVLGWFVGCFGSYDVKLVKGVSILVMKYVFLVYFIVSILIILRSVFLI